MMEVAKRRPKGNRGSGKHSWPDEVDETPFAHVTADIIVRAGRAQPSRLASLLADSPKDDHKGRYLGSTAGVLVYKGEAEPSVIDVSREARARAEAISARRQVDDEVRHLRDELAALKATLAEREAALAQAALVSEKNAERDVKDGETEADQREQSARALEEMREQADAAEEKIRQLHNELTAVRSALADREAELAQAELDHRQTEASDAQIRQLHDELSTLRVALADREAELAHAALDHQQVEAADAQIRQLHDELSVLRLTLTNRDAALAQAALDHEQSRTRREHESQAALSSAEQAWKAAEAARLAEAEAKWQGESAKALAASRVDAEAVEARIRALHDQISAMEASLAERERAFSQSERACEQSQQELESALAKMKGWQAEEAQRLAAAEAQWKAQSAKVLAEAQARYQAAEGTLVQLRLEADRARTQAIGGGISGGSISGSSSRSTDRSVFGTKSPTREPEPATASAKPREVRARGTQEPLIVLEPGRVSQEREYSAPPRKRGALRDVIVVAVLAVGAIVAYPRLEPLIPEPWRSNIAAVTTRFGLSSNVVAQGSAVVARDVNLRSGPSTAAEIIATLPRGLKLTTLARREEWTLVQIEGDSPKQGWVFSSFLATAAGEDDVEAVQPEDSE